MVHVLLSPLKGIEVLRETLVPMWEIETISNQCCLVLRESLVVLSSTLLLVDAFKGGAFGGVWTVIKCTAP
jgi:hypothetical protein